MLLKLLATAAIIGHTRCIRQCDTDSYTIRYDKAKSCYKSNQPIIGWKNTPTVKGCMDFVKERRGLAFNFSPPEAINYTKGYFKNCQVLGCPELSNVSLVMDVAFDYYTAYGNWSSIQDSVCIKSEGVFRIFPSYLNYTEAILNCQSIGGDLADILSEVRTHHLSELIKTHLTNWYRAAYVGLDDMDQEGLFKTAFGSFLGCSKYRAWAPGHPRSKHRKEDCVILDSERTWRVINCKIKLPAICELYPQKHVQSVQNYQFQNVSCHTIRNKRRRKICRKQKEIIELIKNSSRLDQCALSDI